MPVILFSKTDDWSRRAQAAARACFAGDLTIHEGQRGMAFPDKVEVSADTTLLSFLSPWIVPARLLEAAALALNFHPGPRDYPGIGCYNFALYEGAARYGAVCHRMAAKVDTGAILLERSFPVEATDSVESLKLKTMHVMLAMFEEIAASLAAGEALPDDAIAWGREAFTRRQLEALCRLSRSLAPPSTPKCRRARRSPKRKSPVR
jgi:methionyl-tRNA formyltransferase